VGEKGNNLKIYAYIKKTGGIYNHKNMAKNYFLHICFFFSFPIPTYRIIFLLMVRVFLQGNCKKRERWGRG